MTAADYDNATFNVDEYLQLYPDLVQYWDQHASIEEPQWNGDIRYWAASHWQTHGQQEGRQGRISVYQPPITQQQLIDVVTAPVVVKPSTAAATLAAAQANQAAAQSGQKIPTWLWIAAIGVGIYFYRNRQAR